MMTDVAKARIAAHVALLNWLLVLTGTRNGHDHIVVAMMKAMEIEATARPLLPEDK
jgi:hypothetical protein